MPKVNPDILKWARESAGLSLEEATSKLKLNAAYGKTATERLLDLEEGNTEPTRNMLVKMSKKYHRPLLAFYLSEPPLRGDRGQDFRLLPTDQPPINEGLLDALFRDVSARQSLVRESIIDEDEENILEFVGSRNIEDGIEGVLNTLKNTLNLSLQEFRNAPNPAEAFKILRDKAESSGVFILLLGNLGSHHTNIDVETFRGFALADKIAPFIVINDQDSTSAWSFTLLHELAHIILGNTGISGGVPNLNIEKFCNDVASEFLLPSNETHLLQKISEIDFDSSISQINSFAEERNLSRSMIAYKLYRSGIIDKNKWEIFHSHFKNLWNQGKNNQRRIARETEGGPNYYVVRRHRLGKAILETTARFLQKGTLTTTKAGTVLGVKPKNVQQLLSSYV